jgi:hypothetical protein
VAADQPFRAVWDRWQQIQQSRLPTTTARAIALQGSPLVHELSSRVDRIRYEMGRTGESLKTLLALDERDWPAERERAIQFEHDRIQRRREQEIAEIEDKIVDARKIDELRRARPEGCWCFGTGGAAPVTVLSEGVLFALLRRLPRGRGGATAGRGALRADRGPA